MKLSHYTIGRDNNFNLIRILAALAVLVTHSFVVVVGTPAAEPFRDRLAGMTLGSVAVDIFSITSGFLVSASLLNRQSLVDFAWARFLRIYPAFWVMLLLTVFGLGSICTTLPVLSYISNSQTYAYLARCSTLLINLAYRLPGVFESNPYPSTVNGSLWTMRHEVRLYGLLALLWFLGRARPGSRLIAFKIMILAYAGLSSLWVIGGPLHLTSPGEFTKLSCKFFTGAAYYVLRNYLFLSRPGAAVLALAVVLATRQRELFELVYLTTLPYLLFFLAYVPTGLVRRYNRLGDYSYGVYIYAFPIQQLIAATLPGVSVAQMVVVSAGLTLWLSIGSWHLLEKRALGCKGPWVKRTQQWLSRSGFTGRLRAEASASGLS